MGFPGRKKSSKFSMGLILRTLAKKHYFGLLRMDQLPVLQLKVPREGACRELYMKNNFSVFEERVGQSF